MQIRDIAKALRVSVATVSRALNPATEHLVTVKTRERVHRYVRSVGFVPNPHAKGHSTGLTRTIGIILPNVLQSIFF